MNMVVVPGRGGGVPPAATPALPAEFVRNDGNAIAIPCPRAGSARAGLDLRNRTAGFSMSDCGYSIESVGPGEMTALYGTGTCRGAYGGMLRIGRFVDRGIIRVTAIAKGVAGRMLRYVPLDAEAAFSILPMNTTFDYTPAPFQADIHRAHASTHSFRSLPGTSSFFRQRRPKNRIKRIAARAA